MANRVFKTNSYDYCVIDNSAAGNYGSDNFSPASATAIAGAAGYDTPVADKTTAGATSQMKNSVSGGNGSIPDYMVSPSSFTTTAAAPMVIRYKNPA